MVTSVFEQTLGLSIRKAILLGVCLHTAPIVASNTTHVGSALSPKIVGGEATDAGFTWLAYINAGGSACGGTLINDQWILTASHCLDTTAQRDGSFVAISPASITVHPGIWNIGSSSEVSSTAASVIQVIAHENYNDITFDNDIALLELSTTITNIPIQLIREADFLATLNAVDLDGIGPLVTIAGWGTTSESGLGSALLRSVDVPIIAPAACAAAPFSEAVATPALCAGFVEGGRDACQGDSGGPLFASNDKGPVQIGIVSYGQGCAQPENPGVYADVSQLVPWIESKVGVGNIVLTTDINERFLNSASDPAPSVVLVSNSNSGSTDLDDALTGSSSFPFILLLIGFLTALSPWRKI